MRCQRAEAAWPGGGHGVASSSGVVSMGAVTMGTRHRLVGTPLGWLLGRALEMELGQVGYTRGNVNGLFVERIEMKRKMGWAGFEKTAQKSCWELNSLFIFKIFYKL
jgi:hypothetical protein